MYDEILLPTDGSTGTSETVAHAVEVARDNDARVHVLYVVDQRRYQAADEETKAEVVKSLEVEGERAVEDIEVRLEEAGLTVETAIRDGVPNREIVDYVTEADIDLVTMGTHGRTGRDRVANLGSVTERVLKAVDVPVLVVDIGD
jgi:nucleotide-binding universal stress UspA family protein